MRIEEYAALDGIALAELVRNGDVSLEETAQAARAAIAALDDKLNFLVAPIEPPRGGNMHLDAPFLGVPTLVKDIGAALAGVPQELGCKLAEGVTPREESELARRLSDAGLRFIGRSTTPELGSAFTTESRVCGPTRNPWNTDHSTGGSSGGAAAAVAAGAVPLAHAGDSAGSIRIPAHCCGVFGLKPSRGRVPTGPQTGEVNSGLTAGHVITRSVRDSAAALDATAGPDIGARYSSPPPDGTFLSSVGRPALGLRIALSLESPFLATLSPEVSKAAKETAMVLGEMGNSVEAVSLPFSAEEAIANLTTIWCANIHHSVRKMENATGRIADENTLELATLAMVRHGASLTAADLLGALDWMNRFSRQMGGLLDGYDALVTPCFAGTAPPLGLLAHDVEVDDLHVFLAGIFSHAAFTVQYNLTGQPAMSVPLHMSAGGLPIGTQIVGRPNGEQTLFSIAGSLEQALPWRDRHPPVSAFVQGAMA